MRLAVPREMVMKITAGRNHRWFAGNSKQSNDHRGKWL
jgi:hypothetical protein